MGAVATAIRLCVTVGMAPSTASAEPVPCPDEALISVEAASAGRVAQVCDIVAGIRTRLADCQLKQTEPITIRVVPEISHALAGCMAQYDCRDDSIAVTAPETLPGILVPDSLWRRIPTDALFASLIVHELSHAFLDQAQRRGTPCYADHEYVAFALQIDSLDPADRAAIMAGHGIADPGSTARLNDVIAAIDPGYFAQAAWLHFSQPGNGCAFVGELVQGTRTLRVDPY